MKRKIKDIRLQFFFGGNIVAPANMGMRFSFLQTAKISIRLGAILKTGNEVDAEAEDVQSDGTRRKEADHSLYRRIRRHYRLQLRMAFHEKISRSITKAITYRCLIFISDGIIIYLITHRFDLAISVIFFSNIASTILYFIHERLWNKVHWGKKKTVHG